METTGKGAYLILVPGKNRDLELPTIPHPKGRILVDSEFNRPAEHVDEIMTGSAS